MPMLLVSYDLDWPKKDYEPLYEAIKENCSRWWHYLGNTWIVETDESPEAFANLLYPHMVKTDSLLVIEIKGNYHGWLAKDAWKWLNERSY